MSKNRTIDFLSSKNRLDGTEILPRPAADDPTFVPRLSFKATDTQLGPDELAKGITSLPSDVAIFLDNNMWDLSLASNIWPALLSRERGVYVIPGVRVELEPWRKKNASFIGSKAVEEERSPLQLLDLPPEGAERKALTHYSSLLLQRRYAFPYFSANFQRINGRPPTTAETVSGVQKLYGQRALLMAYKDSQAVVPDRRATDEYLVCAAAAHGLATGEPTLVLTRDQDVLEQFYKLWWFLDTHYRAMLLADAYADDPLKYKHLPIPRTVITDSQFNLTDDEFLLTFGNKRMRNCLPRNFNFVSQECWLLKRSLTRLTFGAETEMYRLWETKGATGGLVSDRLNGRNLHSYLGATLLERVNPPLIANCVAVVRDKSFEIPDSDSISLPIIDITYALFSNEHFTNLKRDDRDQQASRIWIPKGV